jgi:four helix bundle protein
MHRFRKLTVYQRSLQFTKTARRVASDFPRNEQFVLTAQFKRAADSIPLNISEGAGNNSVREFSRFLTYSIRSGYECLGCLDIALINSYISSDQHASLDTEIHEIIAMLVGLQNSM